jgi:bifunctional non-homologous end joining protein LigD
VDAVAVSSPEKVLFPSEGITKGEVVGYYARVAPLMLPHVRGRPVALHQFPDGIGAEGFFRKSVPEHFPEFVRRAALPKEGGTTTYAVIDNVETIAYLANQNSITLHVWPARADRPQHPDRMIFDLDPGEAGLGVVRSTARLLLEVLDDLRAPAFVKSTGSSGLHIEVPLDRSASFGEVGPLSRAVAGLVVQRDPEHVTLAKRKAKRGGRLFLDTWRNGYAQHAVAPYAVRALPGAPVAVPLDREEAVRWDFDPRRHTIRTLFRRVAQKHDPWADIGAHAVSAAALRGSLP